jgi:hypothetical protein
MGKQVDGERGWVRMTERLLLSIMENRKLPDLTVPVTW